MNVLEEAAEVVDERQPHYGEPYSNHMCIAKLWQAYFGFTITAEDVAIAMMLVKIGRLKKDPGHHDSIVDIAGYARTYERIRGRA